MFPVDRPDKRRNGPRIGAPIFARSHEPASQPAGEPACPGHQRDHAASAPEKYTSFLAFQATGPMECQILQSLTPVCAVQDANALAMDWQPSTFSPGDAEH